MAAPSTPVAGTPFFDLERPYGACGERPRSLLSHRAGCGVAQRLVPLGVRTIQLRLKDAPRRRIRREIARASRSAPAWLPAHRQRLLARSDELSAPTMCIWARRTWPTPTCPPPGQGRAARHQHAQRGRARDRAGGEPDYVALGPIYETRLKVMKWAPQGLDRVARLEAAHRRPAAGRHRRHHAGTCRRRCRGRRRQRCRHYRFLHPCRSRGPGAPMAGVGTTLHGLNFLGATRWREPSHVAMTDYDNRPAEDWQS